MKLCWLGIHDYGEYITTENDLKGLTPDDWEYDERADYYKCKHCGKEEYPFRNIGGPGEA